MVGPHFAFPLEEGKPGEKAKTYADLALSVGFGATELAAALHWERSRLSHHVKRMETRGLVGREECADDGRGAFVVLTGQGRAAIEQAAPGHTQTVRGLVFDALTEQELATLGVVTSKVLARLEPR